MNKKHKQMSALLMACAMVVSMTACGNSQEKTNTSTDSNTTEKVETSEGEVAEAVAVVEGDTPAEKAKIEDTGEIVPGWQQNADDKVKLSWYMHFSWFNTPWGENLVSKTITEETGVDIEFIIPAGNEAEKLNSLIASDTLPDLITLGFYEQQVNQMIDAGLVYPLDELADQYDPYWYAVAAPEKVGWYTQSDGHIYGYPNSSYTAADNEKYDNISSNQTFLVRKDIYEAIGSPDMSTPEGFKAAVKAAAEKYPTINDQPLIPIGAHEFTSIGCTSFDDYLCNFLAIPYEKDGKFHDRYTDPELVTWLKTFRELGQEGYLADDIFIDKRAQMSEKIAQGRYFCMLFQYTDLANEEKILYDNDPNSIYIAVDGPKNSKGDDHTLPNSGISGWTVTMISKNCERPDRAIQLCSYLMSEHGQHMTWLGVEGETWDYVDGVPTMKPEIKELLQNDRTAYDKQYGADSCYWMFQDNAMALSWAEPKPEPMGQLERWSYPYVISTSEYNMTLEADTEESDIKNKINNEWGIVLPKLLLAPSEEEFDQIWNDFMTKREEWGNQQLIEKQTELMNEAKVKLGITE
ncbi:MAG: extracellular solute-binding protein [Cellulosilyticum sp.]|nr:extracellular solute-binding protein [Cellulosilyticum sp.]